MINPQSVCVSIVTGMEYTQTVYSNESAMLVLENLAFLTGEFCGKHLKKIHNVQKLNGHFVLKQKTEIQYIKVSLSIHSLWHIRESYQIYSYTDF